MSGGRRKRTTTTATGGAVETNYGTLTLASGTTVTFLLESDGTRRIVTPEHLAGKYAVSTTNGWKVA